jgi:hypothetical protein
VTEDGAVVAIATRLGLQPPRNKWDDPWRHFALLYLAHLAGIADWERTHFGHAEALVALEALQSEVEQLALVVRRTPPERGSGWHRRR